MALRDKIFEAARPYLHSGEQVQAVLVAQTVSPYWVLLTWFVLLYKNSYRAIIVTDRRILVLDTGRWRMTTPKRLMRVVSRSTRIGPTEGFWWRCASLGERLYVHRRFHGDVATADALRPVATPLPPPLARH